MSTFFMHSPAREWTEEDLPMDPVVQVGLGSYQSSDGKILLTPTLATDSEVDHYVDGMQAELEKLRRSMKAELPRQRSRILEAVRQRIEDR